MAIIVRLYNLNQAEEEPNAYKKISFYLSKKSMEISNEVMTMAESGFQFRGGKIEKQY